MQKVIFSLFFIFFIVAPHEALLGQRFIGGLSVGTQFGQIDGDDMAGYHKFGFVAGPYVSTILSDRWQLSLELLYSQQGSRLSSSDGFNAAFDKIQLNFVEVPLLINFKEWKFHVKGGFSFQRIIDTKLIDVTGEDVTDQFSLQNNSAAVVIGVTYYSSDRFGYQFRWTKGITDLQAGSGNNKWFVKNISLSLVYLFNTNQN